MRTVGIIAEYNPFHNGHQYQIQYTKEVLGADYTIVAMSGDFVQRGTPAMLPKHVCAEMALRGGADLVLELPVSVSTSSAEFFAAGGVNLLDQLGVVDTLCFGCENNDSALFRETAKILIEEPEYYRAQLKDCLKQGLSFPVARSQALISYFNHLSFSSKKDNLSNKDKIFVDDAFSALSENELNQFFHSPNNILGIEYCKAILRQNSSMTVFPLKREGADYHDLTFTDKQYPSASGIRYLLTRFSVDMSVISTDEDIDKWLANIRKSLCRMIPEEALDIFLDGLTQNGIICEKDLDLLLHYCLLEETFESLTEYSDINAELARRIINCRNQYQNFLQFIELLKTKELTYTRIQRALLHIILKIRHNPDSVHYARVLGFRKSAGPLLKEIKKNSRIPLITKLADAEDILNINGQMMLSENTFASNLYESLVQHNMHGNYRHEYTKPVVII